MAEKKEEKPGKKDVDPKAVADAEASASVEAPEEEESDEEEGSDEEESDEEGSDEDEEGSDEEESDEEESDEEESDEEDSDAEESEDGEDDEADAPVAAKSAGSAKPAAPAPAATKAAATKAAAPKAKTPEKPAASKAAPAITTKASKGDDDAEDEDADEDEDDEARERVARDESTVGVARALGVDGEEDEAEEEAAPAKEETVTNRAQRRREEVARRRAARGGTGAARTVAKPADEDAVEATETERSKLPKDKNARAKELLKRRQESAAGKRVTQLDTAERVQDSLVRATSATGRWLRDNLTLVLGVIILGGGSAIGYTVYTSYKARVVARASDDLTQGLLTTRGVVAAKGDERPDDVKAADPIPVYAYTSLAARADAQLASYKKTIEGHKGTGAATLAQLGAANAYLDKGEWDSAITGFNDVLASPLAKTDIDVKGRALEGIGYAKEGKADYDGALASFKDLEGVDAKSYADLGKYHQARMLLKKGDTDASKEILLALQKKFEVPSLDGSQSQFVRKSTDEYLKLIDPTRVKKTALLGGPRGNAFTPEEMQNMSTEQIRRMIQQQNQQQQDHEGEMPMPGEQ